MGTSIVLIRKKRCKRKVKKIETFVLEQTLNKCQSCVMQIDLTGLSSHSSTFGEAFASPFFHLLIFSRFFRALYRYCFISELAVVHWVIVIAIFLLWFFSALAVILEDYLTCLLIFCFAVAFVQTH